LVSLGLSEIALGQSTTQDSVDVRYTPKQDARCIECLIKERIKDSLIVQQDILSDIKDSLMLNSYNEIDQLRNSLSESELKSEKRLKWIKQGSLFGFLLGIVLGVIATT